MRSRGRVPARRPDTGSVPWRTSTGPTLRPVPRFPADIDPTVNRRQPDTLEHAEQTLAIGPLLVRPSAPSGPRGSHRLLPGRALVGRARWQVPLPSCWPRASASSVVEGPSRWSMKQGRAGSTPQRRSIVQVGRSRPATPMSPVESPRSVGSSSSYSSTGSAASPSDAASIGASTISGIAESSPSSACQWAGTRASVFTKFPTPTRASSEIAPPTPGRSTARRPERRSTTSGCPSGPTSTLSTAGGVRLDRVSAAASASKRARKATCRTAGSRSPPPSRGSSPSAACPSINAAAASSTGPAGSPAACASRRRAATAALARVRTDGAAQTSYRASDASSGGPWRYGASPERASEGESVRALWTRDQVRAASTGNMSAALALGVSGRPCPSAAGIRSTVARGLLS